ncbi:MAG TPA: endonuclease/exonuclease/phosphatase family protein [Casimicrobiaceae bacterium]|jgi:endonuclease/exonuclease/phosphatase (EEP) superfamily protein YafD|nr:endonuclease/exonuclease/phosphatase family protein [Casimicrobiaceae bacterium]
MLVCAVLAASLWACVTVPERQHALVLQSDGTVAQEPLGCGDPDVPRPAAAGALDPGMIRIASWNLHKEADPGWQSDLGRLVAQSDLVLLQEAGVSPALRGVVERMGFSWLLSSAFTYQGFEYGVLTATRVRPASACILRANEPLLGIPKAALITYYRLARRDATLAVVNLHAINFTLGTTAYRAQLEAIAAALSTHAGPIFLGGDFNTWSDARMDVVRAVAMQLSLSPVDFEPDERKRFTGRVFDRVYVRGIEVLGASAWPVASSDHNPVLVSLRVR